MFTITEILSGKHILQLREELLTGMRCRISPERLNRRLDTSFQAPPLPDFCTFCPGGIDTATPTFSDGKRISIGNSTTFPNLFPFAQWHTVTVLTRDHYQEKFSHSDLRDSFLGQIASLKEADGYKSINWNYLPSAGASIAAAVEPAPEIVAMRHELGLDYGKLDYVMNDGEAVLLDVNKTTGASRYMDDEHRRRMRRHQAEGLYSYFKT